MDINFDSDNPYINLLKSITKRFKAEADSDSGLIVINQEDYKILYINNALLTFLNKQWADLILESIATLLKIEEYENLVASQHKNKSFNVERILGKRQTGTSCNIEIISKEGRVSLVMESINYSVGNNTYNLIYGISSPILNTPKCITTTPIDPWINSFVKLMYIVTDDYKRFWMFVFGVLVSISIAQVSVFISKPAFICKDSESTLKSIKSSIEKSNPK
jgi:hypothetical protein